MQGAIIPRCYASVRVIPSPADSHISQAFVYGLLLEDVGGLDLTKFDPPMGDYVSLGHSLMAAVFTFPAYGVLHRDIRSPNILISPPSRISIIDFGHAKIRTSDEEWKQEVQEEARRT